jgi:hypothetical protein
MALIIDGPRLQPSKKALPQQQEISMRGDRNNHVFKLNATHSQGSNPNALSASFRAIRQLIFLGSQKIIRRDRTDTRKGRQYFRRNSHVGGAAVDHEVPGYSTIDHYR